MPKRQLAMHHPAPQLPPWRRASRALARTATLLALLAGLVASACGTNVPTQEPVRLTLAASSSALPLANDLARSYRAAFPHISVDVLAQANEAAATQAVLAGRADAALVAGPVAVPDGLNASHVASEALAIIVHRDRPVENLTVEQVQEVLRGLLRTWDEIGAGEGNIQVMTREQDSGPRLAMAGAFLGAQQLTPTAVVLPDDRQVVARVASDPNAIAAVPAAWLDDQVRVVLIDGIGPEWVARRWPGYPAELPIHLLTPTAATAEVTALRAYLLSARGQQVVGRSYAPVTQMP
jgi:phosphate transport system substrate-binding protein